MAITFWRFTFNGITAYGNGAYDLVGGSVKYRVLTRAKGRCECCGVHEHQRALEGGPYCAEEPRRLGRPQQPAGPLLPLQCRPAMEGEKL